MRSDVLDSVTGLVKGREMVLTAFKSGIFQVSKESQEGERASKTSRANEGERIKILTPNQMPKRLPIALAQVKAGNISESLLNEIRQIVYSLYRSKEITKKVYNQSARDVPRTSPEGPLKVLTSGTSRRLSGDSQGTNTKIDDLMKKMFFRCNSPCFTHLFLIFTEKTNIQKFLIETSMGRLRDPVARRPGDQMMGRSGDVRGTSVINVFKLNSQTH